MKLGLIARADNSGLGVQTWEFARHMQPERVLLIDVGHLHDEDTHTNKRTFLDRYPDALVHKGWTPHSGCLEQFLTGLDVVFTAETPYSSELIPMSEVYRVKTVIQPNWEFLDVRHKPTLWAAPSLWNYDLMPEPRAHLPVPIATDRFGELPDARGSGTLQFLHIVGRPAVHDRNGTAVLLDALEYVKSDITVTIKCQQGGYVSSLRPDLKTKKNVTLIIEPADVDNYWDLYQGYDMMILPRRFGGLCLPVNEALGAGMPVIMPNISPNNTWLPKDWLVPATLQGSFRAKQHVDYYMVDPRDLAALIDDYATNPALYTQAKTQALQLRTELSWETLKPEYERVLSAC